MLGRPAMMLVVVMVMGWRMVVVVVMVMVLLSLLRALFLLVSRTDGRGLPLQSLPRRPPLGPVERVPEVPVSVVKRAVSGAAATQPRRVRQVIGEAPAAGVILPARGRRGVVAPKVGWANSPVVSEKVEDGQALDMLLGIVAMLKHNRIPFLPKCYTQVLQLTMEP